MQVETNIEEINIDPSKSIVIFRVLQEALTNIGKHSGATRADIEINRSDDHLKMTIKDNGKGFEKSKSMHAKSFGVIGMRERASLIDGSFIIEGEPGKGTTIILTVPIIDA